MRNMHSKPGLLLLLLLLCLSCVAFAGEILFVISCPPQYATTSCRSLHDNLRQQQISLDPIPTDYDYAIKVHIMHELFNYWTLLDALPHLRGKTRLLNAQTEWIIWCQHNTHVSSLRALLGQLQHRDAQEMAYYGHALYDAEATIVHHFAHYKNPTWFPYPMLSAGVVFTGALLRRLAELVAASSSSSISSSGSGSSSRRRHSEFAIDAAHELARFIFDNLTPATPNDDEAGNSKNITVEDASNMLQGKIILKSAAYICPSANLSPASSTASSGMPNQRLKKEKSVSCLLYAKSEASTGSSEHCVHTSGSHIYFAIKTCAKFHKERIPIIERTWAPDAGARQQRIYYSDVADAEIPTISTGLPNVATGHCAKTLAILQLSLKDIDELRHIRWLMLVDDDTLLSVPRLSALLSCHNHSEHIYLGERYGYRLYAPDGFNYHTGGAGIVLSVPLLRLVVQRCSCPAANAPDDMILGYCLQALGVPALHAPGLHQARPQDYAPELLQLNAPISFHKYLHTSPEHTYRRWLGGAPSNGSAVAKWQHDAAAADPSQLQGQLPLLQLANMATALEAGGAAKHLDL